MAERLLLKFRTFVKICTDLSVLSHDPKYKVSSIIVTDDFREICSIGYNGDYRGGPNTRSNMEHGQSGFAHAELNALLHLSYPFELRSNLILFCTHKPCSMCARHIANSNIHRVVYDDEYVDDENKVDEIFGNSGIRCRNVTSLICSSQMLKDFINTR